MGGGTTTTQKQKQNTSQNQQTQTGPLPQAMPAINNILHAANSIPLQTTPTPTQQAAFSGLQGATQTAAGLNPQVASTASGMLGGGGAGAGDQYITGALDKANQALSPYLGTSFLDPSTNPYLAPSIQALKDQILNSTKDAFAQSGRFGASGDFNKATSMGLAQGLMPLLLNQWNQNAGLQQGAIGQLMSGNFQGAGGLMNSALARANIAGMAPSLIDSMYNPYLTSLAGSNMQTALPYQNLGYASNLITPLAQLGGTSNSQGSSSGTMSGTTTQMTSPMQTAVGTGLGVGGLLSMGSAGGLGGAAGTGLATQIGKWL